MIAVLIVGLTALVLSLALTPPCRGLALRLGYVDRPDRGRKLHARAVPRIGGLPVAIAYLGAFGFLLTLQLPASNLVAANLGLIQRILPAAAIVLALGLADDLLGLGARAKLAGQAAAGAVCWWGGVRVETLAGLALPSPVSLLVTVLWLAGCCNAFNLIDGLDGLAAGVGALASLAMAAAAWIHGDAGLALACVPLAGALAGFLRYNFHPASIFLGDSGSMLTGFLLGCLGAHWSQKSATLLSVAAPVIALSVPLLDTCLAIVRRAIRRQPLFVGDRAHLHHRLIDRGLSTPGAVALVYCACTIVAGLAVAASALRGRWGVVAVVAFAAGAVAAVRYLDYMEVSAARRLIGLLSLRKPLEEAVSLERLRRSIQAAESPAACYRALRDEALLAGFAAVDFQFGGECFVEDIRDRDGFWQVRVPLEAGWITLLRPFGSEDSANLVGPCVEASRRLLDAKRFEPRARARAAAV